MKSAERPRSFWACMTAKTRSARSDGSAAVISSRISSCGSRASARARSSIRSNGSGTSSACSVRSISRSSSCRRRRTASTDEPVRRRFCSIVRSGTSAGSWKTGASPMRAACAGEETRIASPVHLDHAAVRPDHAGQDLDERALAGAVRAEERVHLTRLDDERGRLQRDHGAVALRDLACGEQAHEGKEGRTPAGAPSPPSALGLRPLAAHELRGRVRRPRLDEQLRAVRRRPLRRVVRLDRCSPRSSCPRPAVSA